MKNKFKKYLLTLSEEFKQELIKFRSTGSTEKVNQDEEEKE